MPGYTLKIKTKSGHQKLEGLDAESSVADFKKKLNELTNIPETNLLLLSGFPPKKLDICDVTSTLKGIGVVNGDTLIVEDKVGSNPPSSSSVQDQEAADAALAQSLACSENNEFNGILMKKVVPADNSCLFTSIGNK